MRPRILVATWFVLLAGFPLDGLASEASAAADSDAQHPSGPRLVTLTNGPGPYAASIEYTLHGNATISARGNVTCADGSPSDLTAGLFLWFPEPDGGPFGFVPWLVSVPYGAVARTPSTQASTERLVSTALPFVGNESFSVGPATYDAHGAFRVLWLSSCEETLSSTLTFGFEGKVRDVHVDWLPKGVARLATMSADELLITDVVTHVRNAWWQRDSAKPLEVYILSVWGGQTLTAPTFRIATNDEMGAERLLLRSTILRHVAPPGLTRITIPAADLIAGPPPFMFWALAAETENPWPTIGSNGNVHEA